MYEFIARHRDKVVGTLSGFDRLVLRGSLRRISYLDGMHDYLRANKVLLKDFGTHANLRTEELKRASLREATETGRPVQYLSSAEINKEARAHEIAERDQIKDGLICVLTCVEPCQTFDIHRSAEQKKLELVIRDRKCLFLYQYWMHPQFGFMNARIQTWFPFTIQVCLNGREWLRRSMDGCGLKYVAAGNCFPWVEDWNLAQKLLNDQLKTDWPSELGKIARSLNPAHLSMFDKYPIEHYWTSYQTEWALDVVFREAADLQELYPRLLHHGITRLSSGDVMRYLGKPVRLDGHVHRDFAGQVVTSLKERQEGVRIRHSVNGNSVKLYDKAFTDLGSVLRAETTIHNGDDLRVFRPTIDQPRGPQAWRKMRRGVADLYRRAELSRKAAERYLDGFSVIDDGSTLDQVLARTRTPTNWRGYRVRALHPFDQDQQLLIAIARGEFTLTGFRNRDLQPYLFDSPAADQAVQRRRSSRTTRQLRLLRAHGLITKIPNSHRYQLTPVGKILVTATRSILTATLSQLASLAA